MSECVPTAKNDLRLLDPKRVRIQPDAFGRLSLEVGFEERYAPVRALRTLPLTRPSEFISLQDEEGEEIGILADLSQLDAESRRAVESELDTHYLKVRVRSIKHVESKNGLISWQLDTDYGPRQVHVRDRQHIRPLPDGRTILLDIYDARYEVPPRDQLDERSRHWLEIEM
jgi:hypothetical protein